MSFYHMVRAVEDGEKALEEITKIMKVALWDDFTEKELIEEVPIENIVVEYLEKAYNVYIYHEDGCFIATNEENIKFFKPYKKHMRVKAPHNYIVRNGSKYISPKYEKYGPYNFVMIHNELNFLQTYQWFRKKYTHIAIFNQLNRELYAKRHYG